MGADITYECVSGNTYKVNLAFYRDCEGITPLPTLTIRVYSNSCIQDFNMNVTLQTGFPIEVSPLCPAQLPFSECKPSGTLPGVQKYLYSGNVTLPVACSDWTFGFSEGYRNHSITTIDKPGSTYLYLESKLNNLVAPCNNSPSFTNIPTPFVCVNQNYLYNHGAVDAEGDSLVYRLADVLNAAGNPATYFTGYSGSSPISSTPAVAINRSNGNISMRPTAIEIGVMAVVVDEYRNGVLIGSVTRDIQITVLSCNNNPPTIGSITSLSSGTLLGPQSIEVCAGVPFSFNINGTDIDVGNTLTMGWNNSISGATFNTSGTSPVVGTFNWTPTSADVGTNSFVINLQDNACPIFGSSALSIDITVLDGLTTGPDQTICLGGSNNSVQLTAQGGTLHRWFILSGDQSSLSCLFCQTPTASPNVTTTYEIFSNLACNNRDTVTVNVVPSFTVSVPGDTAVCGTGNIPLAATPSTGGTFNYLWYPAGGLSSTNTSSTTANPSSSTTYAVEVTSAAGCKVIDSVNIAVSNNDLVANPTSSATQYCAGQPVTLLANVSGASCDNYSALSVAYSPESGNGTLLSLSDDQVTAALPIGFSFDFYCNTYTQFYLSSNGWLSFSSPADPYTTTGPIPSASDPDNIIAFAWDDLDPSSGGTIDYFTTGTAPNRKLVVNFSNVPHYSCGSCLVTTQVVLEEGTNAIEIHNTRVDNHGASGTMTQGIENASGSMGQVVTGRNVSTWSVTNDAVRFSLSATPGTYTVDWQSPLGSSIGSGDMLSVTPGSTTTYYAVVADTSGACETVSSLPVTVAYVDAGPDRTINYGDSAQIDGSYFGPPPVINCDNYTLTSIPYAWISGSGASVSIGTNGISSAISLGFDFDFYCNTYNSVRIAEDGWISFTATSGEEVNTSLPNSAAPNNMIAAVWDNLKQRNFTDIEYRRIGTAPNRMFIVNYNEIVHYTLVGGSNRIWVQIILYEGSNVIEIHNQRVDSDGGFSTQGIENFDGSAGLAVPGRNNANWSVSSSSPNAYRFTPPTAALQYSWSPGSFMNNNSMEDPKASPPVNMWYVLTVDNGECLLKDSMQVFIQPLPVTLVDFQGEKEPDAVKLSWETVEEEKISHFVIQRSKNGTIFERIGSAPAIGTSGTQQLYTHKDESPYTGINYYRLKMVDYDGSFSFSNTVSIFWNEIETHQLLAVYPNPSKGIFNFDLETIGKSDVKIEIFAMDGRLVQQYDGIIEEVGRHTKAIDLTEFANGMYLYQITIDQERFNGKINLIK